MNHAMQSSKTRIQIVTPGRLVLAGFCLAKSESYEARLVGSGQLRVANSSAGSIGTSIDVSADWHIDGSVHWIH